MFTEQTLKFLKSWTRCNTLLGAWTTHHLKVLCSVRTQHHSTQPIFRPLGYKMKFPTGLNTSCFPGAHFGRLDALEMVAVATFLALKNEFSLRCKHSLLNRFVQKQHSHECCKFSLHFSLSFCPCTLCCDVQTLLLWCSYLSAFLLNVFLLRKCSRLCIGII